MTTTEASVASGADRAARETGEPSGPDEPDPSSRSSSAPTVTIEDTTESLSPEDAELVRALATRAVAELGVGGEVRARLLDDAAMAREHDRSHGDATTTDVITYDLAAGEGPLDADLLVGLDVARRESSARCRPLAHELTLYILHGALHCAGHDDRTPDGHRAMHAREDEILEAIGVGAVYRAPERETT